MSKQKGEGTLAARVVSVAALAEFAGDLDIDIDIDVPSWADPEADDFAVEEFISVVFTCPGSQNQITGEITPDYETNSIDYDDLPPWAQRLVDDRRADNAAAASADAATRRAESGGY